MEIRLTNETDKENLEFAIYSLEVAYRRGTAEWEKLDAKRDTKAGRTARAIMKRADLAIRNSKMIRTIIMLQNALSEVK